MAIKNLLMIIFSYGRIFLNAKSGYNPFLEIFLISKGAAGKPFFE